MHAAAGASVGPQVFNSTKSVGLVPFNVMEDSVMIAVPLFVSVTAFVVEVFPCSVVGKARLVALSFSMGAAVPDPVSVTC